MILHLQPERFKKNFLFFFVSEYLKVFLHGQGTCKVLAGEVHCELSTSVVDTVVCPSRVTSHVDSAVMQRPLATGRTIAQNFFLRH